MIGMARAFPELVGRPGTVTDTGIIEVPLEPDPGADYLLPPQWK